MQETEHSTVLQMIHMCEVKGLQLCDAPQTRAEYHVPQHHNRVLSQTLNHVSTVIIQREVISGILQGIDSSYQIQKLIGRRS